MLVKCFFERLFVGVKVFEIVEAGKADVRNSAFAQTRETIADRSVETAVEGWRRTTVMTNGMEWWGCVDDGGWGVLRKVVVMVAVRE